MSQYNKLNDDLILEKYFKCDSCGKLLLMGYYPASKPPKPWSSKEEKKDGFYLQMDYCEDCK